MSSPDKAGVPQPKLAYRLDCHNIMHKKLSGIILNLQGTLQFLETCCLESNREKTPWAILDSTLRTHFQRVSSHMLVLWPVLLWKGCPSLSHVWLRVAAYQRENPS